jgi:hypothetical protein
MATHTDVDYSTRPPGFLGGAPEDIDEIEIILERLDATATPLPNSVIPNLC